MANTAKRTLKLYQAAVKQDWEKVSRLLADGISPVDYISPHTDYTALHWVSASGDLDMMCISASIYSDITLKGTALLHAAVRYNNVKNIQYLLGVHKINPDETLEGCVTTPIDVGIYKRNRKALRSLIKLGARKYCGHSEGNEEYIQLVRKIIADTDSQVKANAAEVPQIPTIKLNNIKVEVITIEDSDHEDESIQTICQILQEELDLERQKHAEETKNVEDLYKDEMVHSQETIKQLLAENAELKKRNNSEDEREKITCKICMENDANILILKCSHLCMCEPCANQLVIINKICPTCRQKFTKLQKVFIA